MTNDSLPRIERWLATRAPRILSESLNPGAAGVRLAALATAVGQPLPEDYKALYQWHDGLNAAGNTGSFFYGLHFLTLAEVLADLRSRQRETTPAPLIEAAAALRAHNLLHPHWLGLGFDGSHTWLRVDLAPTAAGTYGQVIFVDEECEVAFVVATSVTDLLATFAQDLERGLYQLHPDAAEDGEEFLEADARIDLINWRSAERWQHAAQN
ncbi:MAG: SMI1/KNR4 family protein [Hymenobacter sp.]|nr:SMI1/KNR4 family protein [Hymenobacter sp.]